jgi:hypothetical protein
MLMSGNPRFGHAIRVRVCDILRGVGHLKSAGKSLDY